MFVLKLCLAVPLHAQEPPPTIWQSLGIGADQYSDNPAIKAAAKAKAAKHEICKKKRALEYLARMGCTPGHPEVGPALIAAMGDPDEPVRYAAVKAVLTTAGECQSPEQKRSARKALGCVESCHDWKKKCEQAVCDFIDRIFGKAPPKERKCKEHLEECCEILKSKLTGKTPCPDPTKEDCPCGNGQGPCCSPDMKKKLEELAYGRDENGCFLETSERVRTVAELALQACASCAGERFGRPRYSNIVRELPPVLERELPPGAEADACVSNRAVIAVPESKQPEKNQPTPADEPLILPVEPLPPPVTSGVEEPFTRPLRSVLVWPPSLDSERAIGRWGRPRWAASPTLSDGLRSVDDASPGRAEISAHREAGFPQRFNEEGHDVDRRPIQTSPVQAEPRREELPPWRRRSPRWASNAPIPRGSLAPFARAEADAATQKPDLAPTFAPAVQERRETIEMKVVTRPPAPTTPKELVSVATKITKHKPRPQELTAQVSASFPPNGRRSTIWLRGVAICLTAAAFARFAFLWLSRQRSPAGAHHE